MSASQDLPVVEADESNIASLKTIVARSFHPVNPYIRNTLPDTPLMREWWAQNFTEQLRDPRCNVLTVLDQASKDAVGILLLRLMGPQERGSGSWTSRELTDDHDKEAYKPMIDGMTEHRERVMFGTAHFMIELFGVDHALKGRRLGDRLLRRACEIADEAGYPTFVQSNQFAKAFYEKHGFEEKGRSDMPGEIKYSEFMLLRPVPRAEA